MADFPEAFRGALKARGWNQSQAAEKLGISQGLVSAYVRGEREPTLSTLLKISDGLGMGVGDLTGGGRLHLILREEAGTCTTRGRDPLFEQLRGRWHSKPKDRPQMELAIRVLWPEEGDALIAWIRKEH